jgi:PAS domain S-box-containing protein
MLTQNAKSSPQNLMHQTHTSFKKKPLLRHEYLILNKNLIILEASSKAQHFAYCIDDFSVGEDIRVPFPELIGLEDTILDILEGRQSSFDLKGVGRSDGRNTILTESAESASTALLDSNSPLYFDLYISQYYEEYSFETRLMVVLEDATEHMLLKQALAQQINETSLLLSSLAASKNYIDKIIFSMADALLVTTTSGTIKTVNESTQALFGYSEEELINQPVSLLITDEEFLQHMKHRCSSLNGEFLKDIEVSCQTKTGEKISIAFSCSAIQTDIEELQNFVYVGRDITERKRAEAEIIKALEREKELRELKSRFISMASHEFRTPMTSILSSTELLQNYSHRWTDEKKGKLYHRVKDAIKRMTELLDDVLIVNKAESGKLEFNPKPLALEKFCSDLVEEIQLGIAGKYKINFVCLSPGIKPCLDEKLLLHILSNLLTNAIKYSPQDTTVHFSCHCQDEEVIFEIQDEGIGIPTEDQPRLFESFHRGQNVGTIPGTGLGLAIVKNSVELHGGRIMFISEQGVGTTFRVTLPLDNTIRDVPAECLH